MAQNSALNDRIKLEAARWLVRMHARSRTDADVHGLQAWLAADPAHATAFEALTAVWDVAGAYPKRAEIAAARPALSRRAVMAGLAAAPIAGIGAYMLLPHQAVARIYTTRIGEQRIVTLPDNSRAILDTNSRIDVQFDDDKRAITLQYGRANFTAGGNETRPFIVKVANEKIVAQAANFDVRCDDQKTCITVFSGHLSVNTLNKVNRLAAGERLTLTGAATTIDRPNSAAMGAWHTGRTVFENIRLAEAVAEMNRYSQVALEIRGSELGGKRISGIYRNGDNIAFANTVAALVPVTIQETPTHVLLVEKEDSRQTRK